MTQTRSIPPLFPRFRRYSIGGSFPPHIDSADELPMPLTLMIMLSDLGPRDGGMTKFVHTLRPGGIARPKLFNPRKGDLYIWSSCQR